MKTRRTLLPLLLVLALLLAGCGGKEDTVSGTVTPAQDQSSTVPTGTAAAPAEKDVSLGVLEGGAYTSAYAGFGCELDADWVYYGAEELQELPENVHELIENSQLGELMADASQIMDMKAENVNDLTTINVLLTKMGMQERLAYSSLSDEEVLDTILQQSDMMAEAYTQAGFEVSAMEKVTVDFLGETRWALKTSAVTQGVDYYILQVFDYRAGQFGITLTVSSYVEDRTADLLALFYPVA